MSAAHGPIASGDDNSVALTQADGSHGEGPTLLGFGAEGWVYWGLTIFLILAIVVGKAPKRITDLLDARIADTRKQLDEARALRAEAEALLTEARRRHAASAGDAKAIIDHAQTEATALIAKASVDAADLIERRGQMAEEKIAAAERTAVADVRAKVADAAAKAAAVMIRDTLGAQGDKPLVDRTIAGLGRPN